VHTKQTNDTEQFVLDYTKESESICVQTAFRIQNRVGVNGANGELSRKSVFTLGMNIDWTAKL
jgi:hypothetical protein